MHVGDDAIIEDPAGDPPGWIRFNGQLIRSFLSDDFHSAVLFAERVATAAAAAQRSPELSIHGNLVTVALGGDAADQALARRIGRLIGDHRHPLGLAGA
jgi:pterin-4a-carbinolamine dehydratase